MSISFTHLFETVLVKPLEKKKYASYIRYLTIPEHFGNMNILFSRLWNTYPPLRKGLFQISSLSFQF